MSPLEIGFIHSDPSREGKATLEAGSNAIIKSPMGNIIASVNPDDTQAVVRIHSEVRLSVERTSTTDDDFPKTSETGYVLGNGDMLRVREPGTIEPELIILKSVSGEETATLVEL